MNRNAGVMTATIPTALLAAGCALLAVGHAGIDLGVISRLGPGGDRAVVPAVIGFTAAAALLTTTAIGAWRRRSWAWSLGVAVHGIVLMASAVPFRGAGSVAGIALAAISLGALLSPAGRRALLGPRATGDGPVEKSVG